MKMLVFLAAFLVAIGILVAVHEFGHYWVAKKLGFKVLRFSIGFGKPLVMRVGKDADRTEYCLAAIPLGGYVKLLDEREGEVSAEELHRSFTRRPVLHRIAVLLAGLLGTWYYLPSAQHPTPTPIEAVPTRLLPPPPSPPTSVATAEPSKSADTAGAVIITPAPTAPVTVAAAPPPPAAPPVSAPPSTATASSAAPPATETDSDKPAGHNYGGPAAGRIVILGTGKSWVTVKDGAKPILNTLFNKGDSYNVPDREGLTLKTGSAGSLTITLDGKTLAPLGPVGLVRTVPLDPGKLESLAPPG